MIREFKNGLTVKEFKEIVRTWDEEDKYGDPSEVWLMTTPGISQECHGLSTLNGGDLLLEGRGCS